LHSFIPAKKEKQFKPCNILNIRVRKPAFIQMWSHLCNLLSEDLAKIVILVKTGIQLFVTTDNLWIPAYAGMTLV
jgi:hypothetical protein